MLRIAGIDARKIIAAYREIERDENQPRSKRRMAKQAADYSERACAELDSAWTADFAWRQS